MKRNTLFDFWGETCEAMVEQFRQDQARWGDTWKHRPREGQEERAFARFRDYFDQWKHGGRPIPWLKIIGEAHICLVRQDHPEEYIPTPNPATGE